MIIAALLCVTLVLGYSTGPGICDVRGMPATEMTWATRATGASGWKINAPSVFGSSFTTTITIDHDLPNQTFIGFLAYAEHDAAQVGTKVGQWVYGNAVSVGVPAACSSISYPASVLGHTASLTRRTPFSLPPWVPLTFRENITFSVLLLTGTPGVQSTQSFVLLTSRRLTFSDTPPGVPPPPPPPPQLTLSTYSTKVFLSSTNCSASVVEQIQLGCTYCTGAPDQVFVINISRSMLNTYYTNRFVDSAGSSAGIEVLNVSTRSDVTQVWLKWNTSRTETARIVTVRSTYVNVIYGSRQTLSDASAVRFSVVSESLTLPVDFAEFEISVPIDAAMDYSRTYTYGSVTEITNADIRFDFTNNATVFTWFKGGYPVGAVTTFMLTITPEVLAWAACGQQVTVLDPIAGNGEVIALLSISLTLVLIALVYSALVWASRFRRYSDTVHDVVAAQAVVVKSQVTETVANLAK